MEGAGTYHPQHWHDVTETCRITHTYADGVQLIVGQKQKDIPQGTTFIGSNGRIFVNRGKLNSTPAAILEEPLGDEAVRLYESRNHKGNFLDCIKSRKRPICDVEIGHRSATVCHLSNLAVELGRPLQWDPQAERFIGDDEANDLLSRPYRAPWSV